MPDYVTRDYHAGLCHPTTRYRLATTAEKLSRGLLLPGAPRTPPNAAKRQGLDRGLALHHAATATSA